MGVYIKGMVMPYGCANCDFVSEPIYDAKGRAMYVCNAPVEEVSGKENTDEVLALYDGASEYFPEWCPLVEVPEPHGRLIDADALVPDICHDWEGGRIPPDYYSEECIREAPTVIEAEEE